MKKVFLILFCVSCAGLSFFTHVHIFSPIPKKIHYVWFGGPEPLVVRNRIASWKKLMPAYEIKRWDETNCDVTVNDFVKKAYQSKNWRFVSDWCRLVALYQEGGIYLDTDMVLNKSLEPLLIKSLVLAKEKEDSISAGIFAVQKKSPFIKHLMSIYAEFKNLPLEYAPFFWTWAFKEYQNNNKDYIVYPENKLMLDFGGGENVAYHLYANAKSDTNNFTRWYRTFQEKFLKNNAYYLYLDNNLVQYVILLKNKRFYFVKYQDDNHYYHTETQNKGRAFLKSVPFGEVLELKYDDGRFERYICVNKRCW